MYEKTCKRWQAAIADLNRLCSLQNLTSFYKISVTRAFLEAVLSYYLLQGFLIFTPFLTCDIAGKSIDLTQLLLIPLFVLFVVCFVYISGVIAVISANILKLVKGKQDLAYAAFERRLTRTILKTHIAGGCSYCVLSLFISCLYLRYGIALNTSRTVFVLAGTATGTLLGFFWNLCDYLADQRVDWRCIVKPLVLTERETADMLESKFRVMVKHTIALTAYTCAFIGFAFYFFSMGSERLELGTDFFGNAYVLLFATICVLYFKSCYLLYFKKVKDKERVYIHISEFR